MTSRAALRVMLWSLVVLLVGMMWTPGVEIVRGQEAVGTAETTAPTDAAAAATDAAAKTADEAGKTATKDEKEQPKTAMELWAERLKTTGTTGVFLFALSIFGLAFVLERLVKLRRDAVVPSGLAAKLDQMWKAKDFDAIKKECQQSNSVLGRVVWEVVRHRHMGLAEVNTMAGDVASRELRKQHNKAYPIAVVAGLAPLLGLMGTVIGMVGAFETVAAVGSMGDPSVLADDISKALLTTAWGLAIAIPTLAMYHYFKTRTNQFGLVLEEQVSELISEWFHPAPAPGK